MAAGSNVVTGERALLSAGKPPNCSRCTSGRTTTARLPNLVFTMHRGTSQLRQRYDLHALPHLLLSCDAALGRMAFLDLCRGRTNRAHVPHVSFKICRAQHSGIDHAIRGECRTRRRRRFLDSATPTLKPPNSRHQESAPARGFKNTVWLR